MLNKDQQIKARNALQTIRLACGEFKGTLKDHQTIIRAIDLLQDIIFPKKEVKNKPKEEKKDGNHPIY